MSKRITFIVGQWKNITTAVVVLVIAVAVYKVLHHKELLSLPPSILHLALTEETKGEAARQLINSMHGNSITPEDNVIGTYVSPDGSGTLYLSMYGTEEEATAACNTMEHAIANDNPVFTHFRKINAGGQQYSMCLGNAKAHYFFVHKTNLYWWSVDVPVAQASVRDLLKRVQTQK
jgi:hypothetical protein